MRQLPQIGDRVNIHEGEYAGNSGYIEKMFDLDGDETEDGYCVTNITVKIDEGPLAGCWFALPFDSCLEWKSHQ